MSYRHAKHAGNFADVVKHVVLLATLRCLQADPAPLSVIDTHAARGIYGGVRAYVGSPFLIAQLLRPQDTLTAVEIEGEEAAVLRSVLSLFTNARVIEADGYSFLRKPWLPVEPRSLVLVDPPYEHAAVDVESAAVALGYAYSRAASATYLLWFPITEHLTQASFCQRVLPSAVTAAACITATTLEVDAGGLNAAGLLIVNPPSQLVSAVQPALAACAAALLLETATFTGDALCH
jgi:23S rRNA (adenine2030-N6)-methyltransferase